jgi:putative addiction module killer protein
LICDIQITGDQRECIEFELRLDFGPGYRVHFGIDSDEIILLGAGDKSFQARDIQMSKECWKDYNA